MLSIAHGLAVINASAREAISDTITADPAILKARLEDQFEKLILQPSFQTQGRHPPPNSSLRFEGPDLIIIDGLDECGDEQVQLRILSIIASGYQRSPTFPLRFLLCSRSESWIQEAFDVQPLHPLTKHLALDRDSLPDKDIELYYLHEFERIRTSPKYRRIRFPVPWPSKEDLRLLLKKSSGQFVYAATATGFVKSGSSNPVKQLQIILEYYPEKRTSKSPFPELDGLDYIVLCANTEDDEGEVDLALRSMHSVLDIRGSEAGIRVFHTSFIEYLKDVSRSGRFYIDEEKQGRSLALSWLRAIAREMKVSSEIVLKPSRRPQLFGQLVAGWTAFCIRNEFMTDPEFSREVDNLASVLLLPSHKLPHQLHVNDLLVGVSRGDTFSTLELLESYRLATDRRMIGSGDVCPLLRDILADFVTDSARSGEFFVEKDSQRRSLALSWVRILTEEVKKTPRLVLNRELWTRPLDVMNGDSNSLALHVLVDGWADLCLEDKESITEAEFSRGLNDLYHSILSVFPDRHRLIAVLVSLVLLPAHTHRADLHFHNLLLELPQGYVLSVVESLHSGRLVVQNPRQKEHWPGGNERWGMWWKPGVPFEIDPYFLDFLRDPTRSGEFYIGDAQHRSLALRWIRALARQMKETPGIMSDQYPYPRTEPRVDLV
ncbi:hypothetical protein V5O48_011621 [Marasmius crinis-equi]|uniref:NACHT domain-containing protein n=1 Tax=Marasmius crinis-equi TaxID=585013 RepID=A0ABR3F565_9AGAR